MKSIQIAILLLIMWEANSLSAQQSSDIPQPDTIKKSIPRELKTQIGDADIHIKYHSPAVRKRIIWGGLVPFEQVWVTGAHSATSIEVSKAFEIGGKTVQAGKYALFTIPDKDRWTVILNKNWQQHLTDNYNESEDILRFAVQVQSVAHTERLTYSLEKSSEGAHTVHRTPSNGQGELSIAWEKVKISFPIRIQSATSAVEKQVKTDLQTDTLRVNGDCGMCKKRIEAACYAFKGLENAVWDEDSLILIISYDPTRTNPDVILKKIASIGYDNEKYKAPDDAYKALPECCQYDRSRFGIKN
jgi:hypothetical protein